MTKMIITFPRWTRKDSFDSTKMMKNVSIEKWSSDAVWLSMKIDEREENLPNQYLPKSEWHEDAIKQRHRRSSMRRGKEGQSCWMFIKSFGNENESERRGWREIILPTESDRMKIIIVHSSTFRSIDCVFRSRNSFLMENVKVMMFLID